MVGTVLRADGMKRKCCFMVNVTFMRFEKILQNDLTENRKLIHSQKDFVL